MFAKLIGTLVTRLLTEKVVISVLLFIADWLVHQTTTKVDDEWYAKIEEVLLEDLGSCQMKSNVLLKENDSKVSSGEQKTGKD